MDISRRDVLVAGAAALAASSSLADPVAPLGETAQGRVLDDATGHGLPHILVSNGRIVVRTGDDGGYSLPVRDGDSIFVIKPRGWMVKLEPRTGLPRFAYVHEPAGTPAHLNLRYNGIAPTGPLPPSIDFRLHGSEEPDRFDVLLFTDPQPESDAELTYVRDTAVAAAAAIPAAFGITTGDIMFDDLSLYGRSNRLLGALGLPWWNVSGNHDMNYEAPDNRFSRETFKRLFGARHYAFQYGPATFLMLDNVEYLGNEKYQGRLGEEQLGFIGAVLAELPHDALVVLCMHIPLRTQVGDEPFSATTDWQELIRLIGDRPNCISFAGHTHTNEHHYLGPAKHHHHVLTAVSGSWWSGPYDVRGVPVALATDGTPNGFHVLSVDGNHATTRLVWLSDPQAAPMRIILDTQFARRTSEVAREVSLPDMLGGRITQDELASARLLVNFFPGGPNSALHFTIEGQDTPYKLAPTVEIDPFVQQVYWRNNATKKPWVQPVKSTHLWAAKLPAGLAPGTHRVSVRALDEFCVAFSQSFMLEISV